MSDFQKFLFEGLPVRGMLVRLTDSWQTLQSRREQPMPPAVMRLLGEMSACALLLQSNLKFDGALILQVQGDGPVKLAVAEARNGLAYRATAQVRGTVAAEADLAAMVNPLGQGRCALTLDPSDRQRGVQPYQGVVALQDDAGRPFPRLAQAVEHYMKQSEQLEYNRLRRSGEIFSNYVTEGDGLRVAAANRQPVFDVPGANAAKQAAQFRALAKEFLRVCL